MNSEYFNCLHFKINIPTAVHKYTFSMELHLQTSYRHNLNIMIIETSNSGTQK